jgi:hypothetical protein
VAHPTGWPECEIADPLMIYILIFGNIYIHRREGFGKIYIRGFGEIYIS